VSDPLEWRTIIMRQKLRIALAATLMALAAVSVDSASAASAIEYGDHGRPVARRRRNRHRLYKFRIALAATLLALAAVSAVDSGWELAVDVV
jgi:hypothetical protein